ncbi:MAG: cyclic nucleotide-binding domain-containing protein [Cytophagales bacterium]|nr:cyclic nucleotide-binding domain-containing protein [Cytophagales bacterium]
MLGLDMAGLNEFGIKFETLNFPPDTTIIKKGELADKFYIITQGEVEIINYNRDGTEIPITRLGYGEYFGEIGLLRGGRRTATVRATAYGAEVSSINQEAFRKLMTQPSIQQDDIITLLTFGAS